MPANTDLADVNEIYTAFALNENKFPDTASEAQYTKKLALLTADQGSQQIGRAAVMAEEFLKWARKNGYSGVQNVYWTARPGFSFKQVTGTDVDQKKNPTDVLVKFTRGGFLGLSAKSTSGKGDIGFKNPGVGTVEKDLGIALSKFNKDATDEVVKVFKLPTSASARKSAIRGAKAIQMQTDKMGSEVLNKCRDAMLTKLNSMAQKDRKDYIMRGWIDASTELFPPYVKVTGKGRKAPFTAEVEDPLNNPKLEAIMTEKIGFEKVGNDSIGVKAGSKKILKMRFKYESEKLASSLKMSGDPW
tara:strand:- start:9595 stop:10500 length:906 start_codon:yes stop_codon:yes gene_type:complete